MPRIRLGKFFVASIVSLQLSACQQNADAPANITPARPEYTGPAAYRVRLTAKRAEELGLQTDAVREEQQSGKVRKMIPASAVVRDQRGNTWAFKNPAALVFVRERIRVDSLDGDWAILSDGPAAGTAIVTTGAAELFSDELSDNPEGPVAENGGREEKKSSGTATMLENGNLRVVYKTAGLSGLAASVVIEYKPQDEEYQKIIDQVGGLKIGETKSVPSGQ